MDLEEQWALVAGFPEYAVSNYGVVQNVRTGRDLRPKVDSYGYCRVTLRRDGHNHDRYIHQLVAQAFVTGYRDGVYIRHADGDRGNNYVVNLRFKGGYRLGQLVKNVDRASFRRIRVVETGEVFRNIRALVNYFGGDPSSFYKVLRGERRSHKGFSFEYLEEQ